MEDTRLIHTQVGYEIDRKCLSEGFPPFLDLLGRRYTDPRFYNLEKQHPLGNLQNNLSD